MLVVTGKTIGFTSDGTLLIFDSRAEFVEWAEGREDYEVWAEPKWLFNTLREQEKIIEEKDDEGGIITERDSLGQWNEESREAEEEEACHILCESYRRAKKAGEDNSQRKIWEGCIEDVD